MRRDWHRRRRGSLMGPMIRACCTGWSLAIQRHVGALVLLLFVGLVAAWLPAAVRRVCRLSRAYARSDASSEQRRQVIRWTGRASEQEPCARRGKTQHVGRRQASTPHLSNAGVAIGLAQLHARRAIEQRMMKKHRGSRRPSSRAMRICRPVDASRSSPRMTRSMPWSMSSTVTAH